MIDLSNWLINQANTTALILSKQVSCHSAQMCEQLGENLYCVLFQIVNSCCEPIKADQMSGMLPNSWPYSVNH